MQHPNTHHWYSSLLTGLCVVGGFGLGVLWHEQPLNPAPELPPFTSAWNEPGLEDAVALCCADTTQDEKDKDKDKADKKKTRPRVRVMPHGLTDDHMKRVEEALQRAQESLEKEGLEVPEEFRQHMQNFRKQMREHQKLLENQLKDLDLQFKDLDGLKGLEGLKKLEGLKDLEGLKGLEGLKDLPEHFRHFRMPEGSGSGVAIILNRTDDGYSIERREGALSIKVAGQAGEKEGATSITIKNDGKEKSYKNLKEVPAEYRDRVCELIEMGSSGRVVVRPRPDAQPKKERKEQKSESQREFY